MGKESIGGGESEIGAYAALPIVELKKHYLSQCNLGRIKVASDP